MADFASVTARTALYNSNLLDLIDEGKNTSSKAVRDPAKIHKAREERARKRGAKKQSVPSVETRAGRMDPLEQFHQEEAIRRSMQVQDPLGAAAHSSAERISAAADRAGVWVVTSPSHSQADSLMGTRPQLGKDEQTLSAAMREADRCVDDYLDDSHSESSCGSNDPGSPVAEMLATQSDTSTVPTKPSTSHRATHAFYRLPAGRLKLTLRDPSPASQGHVWIERVEKDSPLYGRVKEDDWIIAINGEVVNEFDCHSLYSLAQPRLE